MSWGYWGIVGGVAAMLMVFFVSMELLFPGAKRSTHREGGAAKGAVEPTQKTPARSRHAA